MKKEKSETDSDSCIYYYGMHSNHYFYSDIAGTSEKKHP